MCAPKEPINIIGCCQAAGVTSVFLLLVGYPNEAHIPSELTTHMNTNLGISTIHPSFGRSFFKSCCVSCQRLLQKSLTGEGFFFFTYFIGELKKITFFGCFIKSNFCDVRWPLIIKYNSRLQR